MNQSYKLNLVKLPICHMKCICSGSDNYLLISTFDLFFKLLKYSRGQFKELLSIKTILPIVQSCMEIKSDEKLVIYMADTAGNIHSSKVNGNLGQIQYCSYSNQSCLYTNLEILNVNQKEMYKYSVILLKCIAQSIYALNLNGFLKIISLTNYQLQGHINFNYKVVAAISINYQLESKPRQILCISFHHRKTPTLILCELNYQSYLKQFQTQLKLQQQQDPYNQYTLIDYSKSLKIIVCASTMNRIQLYNIKYYEYQKNKTEYSYLFSQKVFSFEPNFQTNSIISFQVHYNLILVIKNNCIILFDLNLKKKLIFKDEFMNLVWGFILNCTEKNVVILLSKGFNYQIQQKHMKSSKLDLKQYPFN